MACFLHKVEDSHLGPCPRNLTRNLEIDYTCPGYSGQAGCSPPPRLWVLWPYQGLSAQGLPGDSYPLWKNQTRFPRTPLSSGEPHANLRPLLKIRLRDLWANPLHHPRLWVLLQNKAPTRLGHSHCGCRAQN